MWPGQQPPGGEQNPQDQNPNPYQQPGYQQPNPYQQPGYQQPGYQQPGYQQPNPYQQPTVPQYGIPGPPGGPGPSQDKKKTTVVAIVAATAVVIAAGVTGFLVLNKDDDTTDRADGDSTASASAKPTAKPSVDNPRDGSENKPQIAGWKVVTNPQHGTQFDVPADWEVENPGVISGIEIEEKGDGNPVLAFSAPATYKSAWCSEDTNKDGKMEDHGLGHTGTKGGQGATDTASGSKNEAGSWAWAAYAQQETKAVAKQKVKVSEPEAYTTTSGLKGHFSTAETTGVTKKTKCDTDGKSIAFTFTNAKGDYATWVLYTSRDVPDEIPDTTVKKILGTVRLLGTS
ncbi:hypothetical protein ACFVWX_26775 [Streptomyces sp. NPDC058220]|uniref:hypothetical protein n=1 Tax=unclassified Streptomyces TaxID=2593676 RepID=UPI00365C60BA